MRQHDSTKYKIQVHNTNIQKQKTTKQDKNYSNIHIRTEINKLSTSN